MSAAATIILVSPCFCVYLPAAYPDISTGIALVYGKLGLWGKNCEMKLGTMQVCICPWLHANAGILRRHMYAIITCVCVYTHLCYLAGKYIIYTDSNFYICIFVVVLRYKDCCHCLTNPISWEGAFFLFLLKMPLFICHFWFNLYDVINRFSESNRKKWIGSTFKLACAPRIYVDAISPCCCCKNEAFFSIARCLLTSGSPARKATI